MFLGPLDFLEDLVDDPAGQQNPRSCPDSPQEISDQGERADAKSAEVGGDVDVPVELLLQEFLCSTVGCDVLVLEILGNLLGAVPPYCYPEPGDQRAGDQDEGDIDDRVEGVAQHALH